MNRRGFVGALLGVAAAIAVPFKALARPEYPSFVRQKVRMTPTWRYVEAGERQYSIMGDEFYVCRKAHWQLATRHEDTNEPDCGLSPKQLGYRATGAELPDWGESGNEYWVRG